MSNQFEQQAKAPSSTPFPPIPKLPEALIARLPEIRDALEDYNRKWADFFQQCRNAGLIR